MKNKIYLGAVMFIGIVMFSGCAKDGAMGDQGPQGVQGPIGNANVAATTFQVNSWSANGSSYYYASFTDPDLTSDGNNSGAVEVFFSTDGGTTWDAVPFSQVNYPNGNYYMSFITQTNLVEVDWVHDGGTLGTDPNSFYDISSSQFKVVVIPPAMMKPNVNLKNYAAVKAAYNLKD